MKKISRRDFIYNGAAGFAGLASISAGNYSFTKAETIDKVRLGKTGLKVSRVALGTGSFGWKRVSNQTKLGTSKFVDLAKYCFERGIQFIDTADMYGSHPFTGEALKVLPREKVTVLTKVMIRNYDGWYNAEPFNTSLDRFRKELGTEYIDIMLMHCMTDGKWHNDFKVYMDGLSEAKSKGIVKAVGVSCHSMEALQEAAKNPWVDVILARINHHGAKMDGTPEDIMNILRIAKENGKGIIGMKIFGCGELIKDEEREKSLKYVLKSGNVDCMTLGLESKEQVDDAVSRITRILKA